MQSWCHLKSAVKTWTCDSLLHGPSHSLSTSMTFAWESKVHSASSQLTRSPGAPHSSSPAIVNPTILSKDKEELNTFKLAIFTGYSPVWSDPIISLRLAGLF